MFVLRRFIDLVPIKKEISQVKSGRTNAFLKIFSSPQHSKKEIQSPATNWITVTKASEEITNVLSLRDKLGTY